MTTKSNPVTLREALRAQLEERARQECPKGSHEDHECETCEHCHYYVDTAWIGVETALAASGTEAAPDKAMLALESLTPGGSEYVGDIKRCVETVRETRRSQMEQIVKLTKRVHELEAAASPEGEGREADDVHALFEKWWDFAEATLAVDLKGMARDAFCAGWACGEAPLRQSAAPSGGKTFSDGKISAANEALRRYKAGILVNAARLIRLRKREGADNEEIEGCAMVCDAMRDDAAPSVGAAQDTDWYEVAGGWHKRFDEVSSELAKTKQLLTETRDSALEEAAEAVDGFPLVPEIIRDLIGAPHKATPTDAIASKSIQDNGLTALPESTALSQDSKTGAVTETK